MIFVRNLDNIEIKQKRNYLKSIGKDAYLIYGYLCKITQKWYIGQTVESTLQKRARGSGYGYINSHGKKMKTKFANAILKYGWINFQPYIFEVCSIDEVDKLEEKYIKIFDSLKNGYNSQSGGQKHHRHTEETKLKISLMKRGAKNYNYGGGMATKKQIENSKRVASTILQSPEVRKKVFENRCKGEKHYLYGKNMDIKIKNKISNSLKGRYKYGNNPLAKKIYCITDDKIFSCAKEAADYYGLTSGTSITACCKKKRNKAAKKEFMYYEEKYNNE